MTDREFDDILKSKLDQFREEYDPSSWDSLEQRIESEGLAEGNGFDQSIRAAMAGFVGEELSPDWERMEERLDAEDAQAFDDHVKEKVGRYSAPYDPASWPILSDKITADERLRRRLIAVKVLEVVAVLFALLTLFNFLPILEKALIDKDEQVVSMNEQGASIRMETVIDKEAPIATDETSGTRSNVLEGAATDDGSEAQAKQRLESEAVSIANGQVASPAGAATGLLRADGRNGNDVLLEPIGAINSSVAYNFPGSAGEKCEVTPTLRRGDLTYPALATIDLPGQLTFSAMQPTPLTELPSRGKGLLLGLVTSLDFNGLYMPADQFYADGRKINFSEKHLLATGYTVGATLLFDRGAWAFETGLLYSQKSFEPNRVLQIGKTFDVRTVDFDEISMHVVKVPLNGRWNFDRKGKTRFYVAGGIGFNLIASANYDLLTRGGIGSRPSGGTRTDFEVARVRENFLDGAEFSSKSFITVSGGIGVEHHLNTKLSLFAQPTFDYQTPFFPFHDREGKHLQFLSLQFGTRVRLK